MSKLPWYDWTQPDTLAYFRYRQVVQADVLGLSQSDARTDIYAAGVLYNVMLTGNHPTKTFARGYAGRVVRKCTALNPNDRYQSAKELAAKL